VKCGKETKCFTELTPRSSPKLRPDSPAPLLNPLEGELKTNRLSEKLSQRHSTKSLKHSRFFEGKARWVSQKNGV